MEQIWNLPILWLGHPLSVDGNSCVGRQNQICSCRLIVTFSRRFSFFMLRAHTSYSKKLLCFGGRQQRMESHLDGRSSVLISTWQDHSPLRYAPKVQEAVDALPETVLVHLPVPDPYRFHLRFHHPVHQQRDKHWKYVLAVLHLPDRSRRHLFSRLEFDQLQPHHAQRIRDLIAWIVALSSLHFMGRFTVLVPACPVPCLCGYSTLPWGSVLRSQDGDLQEPLHCANESTLGRFAEDIDWCHSCRAWWKRRRRKRDRNYTGRGRARCTKQQFQRIRVQLLCKYKCSLVHPNFACCQLVW